MTRGGPSPLVQYAISAPSGDGTRDSRASCSLVTHRSVRPDPWPTTRRPVLPILSSRVMQRNGTTLSRPSGAADGAQIGVQNARRRSPPEVLWLLRRPGDREREVRG